MQLNVKLLIPTAIMPRYQSDGASGFDLHATENITIGAGKRAIVSTGLAVAVPEGYELQVRPRSGLAAREKVTVLNTPGTVDADYRGEVKVILINHGSDGFRVEIGDRIAQGVVCPVVRAELVEVETLDDSVRGDGGFGSTGV